MTAQNMTAQIENMDTQNQNQKVVVKEKPTKPTKPTKSAKSTKLLRDINDIFEYAYEIRNSDITIDEAYDALVKNQELTQALLEKNKCKIDVKGIKEQRRIEWEENKKLQADNEGNSGITKYYNTQYFYNTKYFKGKYIAPEIPKDIPFIEYKRYIIQNIPCKVYGKPESEWTELDFKEVHSRKMRLSAAFAIKTKFSGRGKETLKPREKRMIEKVRNGTDFDVPNEKHWVLYERPTLHPDIRLFDEEYECQYLKENPDMVQEKQRLLDVLEGDYIWEAFVDRSFDKQKKKCKGKIIDGTYYDEPIPEGIPFTEYARYIYWNFDHDYNHGRGNMTEFDKLEREANRKRLFAAFIIGEWEKPELTEWQQKVIEDIRIGVELEDSNDDTDYVRLLSWGE